MLSSELGFQLRDQGVWPAIVTSLISGIPGFKQLFCSILKWSTEGAMEAECRGHNESNNNSFSLFKKVNISDNKQI